MAKVHSDLVGPVSTTCPYEDCGKTLSNKASLKIHILHHHEKQKNCMLFNRLTANFHIIMLFKNTYVLTFSRPPSALASRAFRDISPKKVLPEAMTKTCLVRCKVSFIRYVLRFFLSLYKNYILCFIHLRVE